MKKSETDIQVPDFLKKKDVGQDDGRNQESTTGETSKTNHDSEKGDGEDTGSEQGEESKKKESIFTKLEQQIKDSDLPEAEKAKRLARLIQMSKEKVNIMLVGATGRGKSSTINALFDMEVAKVGIGVDAETDSITKFELENLTIWDTPGLGDDKKADKKYKDMLIRKLIETDEEGVPLIDLVLVILDASSKDLGTSFDLINNVIIPCLGDEASERVIIGLNQADVAMKGRHWKSEENKPDEKLMEYLKEKADSVRNRIFEATGISIRPVYYCAGYTEEDGERCAPYNLTKLLYYVLNSIPENKRLILADHLNLDEDA